MVLLVFDILSETPLTTNDPEFIDLTSPEGILNPTIPTEPKDWADFFDPDVVMKDGPINLT